MFERTERSFRFKKNGEFFLFKKAKATGWLTFSHYVSGRRCGKTAIIMCPQSLRLPNGVPNLKLVKINLEQLNPLDVRIIGKFDFIFNLNNHFLRYLQSWRQKKTGTAKTSETNSSLISGLCIGPGKPIRPSGDCWWGGAKGDKFFGGGFGLRLLHKGDDYVSFFFCLVF